MWKIVSQTVLFLLFFSSVFAQNQAAHFTGVPTSTPFQTFNCGNIPITGNKLTVEAIVHYDAGLNYWASGRLVDKLHDTEDPMIGINSVFCLRLDGCSIRTSNGLWGYFGDNHAGGYSMDTFHVAVVYDGSSLKFYKNGCVVSTYTPCFGTLAPSNQPIMLASPGTNISTHLPEQFKGHLDEVRIWSVARTEQEIQDNMRNLPNPTSQTGLLAYYKFDGNSVNVQGNAAYNAVPVNGPSIDPWTIPDNVKPLEVTSSFTQPSCTGSDGSITLQATGGPKNGSYVYSLNGGAFQSSNTFSNLGPGNYTVNVRAYIPDVNSCTRSLSLTLTPSCTTSTASTASFTAPDTVCVNDPVPITNTSTGASTYFWNFCVADVNTPPTATNLGNPGSLSQPVFVDMEQFNGNYYGFVVDHNPGGITRLDFGNSPLNTPTSVYLGNISGVMNANFGNEGIQIVNNNGNWYGITVGGAASSATIPKLVIIKFGPNLNNPSPTAVAYPNIGGMNQPIDLHVFQENSNWYGFTVNAESNTITRFDFTNDFNNTPTAVNLGNIGGLNYPTGVYAANDNGFWRVFVTNQNSNSITRLDFGSSLLNTPTGVNLGNPGGTLGFPRDITILKYCGQSVGFVVNGSTNTISRINFSSLSSVPTGTNLGNLGSLNFPHSLSKLFRVGNDIYSFITNVNNNTITRLKFSGCTSSSIPSSAAQTPPSVSYSTPGTYNINLTIDDGLPSQTAFCKQVVVLAKPSVTTPMADVTICPGNSTTLSAQVAGATSFSWAPSAGLSSTTVSNPVANPTVTTQYVVTASNGKCTITDTVIVKVLTPLQCSGSTAIAGFTAPDTVCVNAPVNITNTSVGASSYYWSFCLADLNVAPVGTDLGNISNKLSVPVFMDYVFYNGNYYGFLINYDPGSLVRLDFGNSLLNTPTAINMGNFGGVIPPGLGAEGIQIVNNEDRWYAIVVGGYTPSGSTPRVLKIDFGPDLTNLSPVATNWGNLGNMSQPIDLHVFKEGANWYGFTVNAENNSITRFNFTASFNNTPTAVNLGNIGNLSYPTGIYAINDNGFWRVFIVNAGNGDRTSGVFSLTRLDFGSSLLNTPTGVNLGNPGNMLKHPRDLTIMKMCDQIIGFAIDGHPSFNSVVKLNFNNDLTTIPTITSLGNIGGLNFPHSISKLFRVGNDVYSFITNAYGNNLSRLKFSGCTNSSIPTSTAQTPPPVSYNTPGTYNITLTVDDGLPTQSSFCKKVVVMPIPAHQPTQQYTLCPGVNLKIGAATHPGTYLWNTGATTDSITVSTSGTYWVQTTRSGCSIVDSFIVSVTPKPAVDFGFVQNTCQPKTVQFSSNFTGVSSYTWNFGDNQTNTTTQSPVHTYADYGTYTIKLKYLFGSCSDSVVKTVSIDNVFDGNLLGNSDTTICLGDSVLVRSNANIVNYCFQTSGVPGPFTINGYVKPTVNTVYKITSQVLGPNLIVNGNFSGGNISFSSDYSYNFPNTTEGQYWVGLNPSSWNAGMSNCSDHTGGGGNMMLVNGSPAINKKIWSQTITVLPNTTYDFSGWITSLSSPNPAQLQFSINNINLGNSISAGASTCQWGQFSSAWNSGSNTSAVISIVNNNTVVTGNDFALDDLYFGQVTTKTDSFSVNITGLCDSIKLTGGDKVCTPADTLTYSIYKSPRCTQPYIITVDPAFATIVSQTPTSIRVVFLQNGTTSVKVSFANSCKVVVDSVKVTVKFSPTSINLGPDVNTCADTSFVLHAGAGFGSYTWQDGTTDSVYNVHVAGTYRVLAKNICGAQFADTLSFTRFFPRPFSAAPLQATVCAGDSVVFKASGGTSYNWSPAGNFSHPDSSVTKAMVDITELFTLSITDTVCRRDTLVTIPVTASRVDNLTVFKSNDVTCSNDSAVLTANGASTYTWSPNLYVTHSANGNITVKPPVSTTYYVLGTNDLGCTRQDSVTVYFTKEGDQKLYVPDAFTPNGDGLNDVFKPIFIGPAIKYDFKVFNRWGQLIFHSTTPNAGWDGNFRSVLQPGDAYVYYVTAEGGCNGKFVQKGTFVLIR